MYDPPELRPVVDAWWRGLANAFRAEGVPGVPDGLDRALTFDMLWSAPDLLFAQACGFPLTGAWADRLQYVATPCYAAPGCEGSSYRSFLVVAAGSAAQCVDDLRGARCSINSRISHSGFNALRAHVSPLARDGAFFGSVSVSGGHSESLSDIERGVVDVAAIDATRVVGRTRLAPGLPYVTRLDVPPALRERLRAGVLRACADASLAAVRAELLICGVEVLPAGSYGCMGDMADDARRRGYGELDG
jgi:hypothetical protein